MFPCTDGKNSQKCGKNLRNKIIMAAPEGLPFYVRRRTGRRKFMWTDLLLRDFWWKWFSSLQQQWNAENHGIFC